MTSLSTKTGEDYERMGIDPRPLADPDEHVITRVWYSVPVFELDQLLDQSRGRKADLNAAFRKLNFQVNHPEAQLRPGEAPSVLPDEGEYV
jgi:hypothetical protein